MGRSNSSCCRDKAAQGKALSKSLVNRDPGDSVDPLNFELRVSDATTTDLTDLSPTSLIFRPRSRSRRFAVGGPVVGSLRRVGVIFLFSILCHPFQKLLYFLKKKQTFFKFHYASYFSKVKSIILQILIQRFLRERGKFCCRVYSVP